MDKCYSIVDLFVYTSLAAILSFSFFIKWVSWFGFGGIIMPLNNGSGAMPAAFDYWSVIAAIVGIIIVLLLIMLLWRKGKECKNFNEEWWTHPLGLPTGSVRALIAILILATMIFYGATHPSLPDWLSGLVGTVIGFYFGERKGSEQKEPDLEKLKGIVEGSGSETEKINQIKGLLEIK